MEDIEQQTRVVLTEGMVHPEFDSPFTVRFHSPLVPSRHIDARGSWRKLIILLRHPGTISFAQNQERLEFLAASECRAGKGRNTAHLLVRPPSLCEGMASQGLILSQEKSRARRPGGGPAITYPLLTSIPIERERSFMDPGLGMWSVITNSVPPFFTQSLRV